MSESKFMSRKWEFLIEQELYVLALVLNGLPAVEALAINSLLRDRCLVKELSSRFALSKRAWIDRRTTRNGQFDLLSKSEPFSLKSIVDDLNLLLNKLSVAVAARILTGGELISLAGSLKSQSNLKASSQVVGFFIKPKDFVNVRECWVVIGVLAQLLCVLGEEFGRGVFISHGIDHATLPASLGALEYIVAFE